MNATAAAVFSTLLFASHAVADNPKPTETEWQVIGEALSLLGGFLGAIAATIALAAFYPEREERLRGWLTRAWQLVHRTSVRDLPRALALRFITAHDALALRVEEGIVSTIGVVLLVAGSFALFFFGFRWAGWFWNFHYFSVRSPGLIFMCLYLFRFVAIKISPLLRIVTDVVLYVGVFLIFSGLYYRMIEKALTLPNPTHALMALVILSPAAMYVPGFALPAMDSLAKWLNWKETSDEVDRMLVTGGLALGVSFSVTMAALVFGTMVSPSEILPRGSHLFLSNVIFDALTFTATVVILRRAHESSRAFAMLAAILMSLLVAAFFACASLWLGLLGSNESLSVVGVACTLLGRDPSCRSVQLGPFFWAMHTSFLPTAACLLLLAFAVGGRFVSLTVERVLQKAKAETHPYGYTSLLVGMVAAWVLAIAEVFKKM